MWQKRLGPESTTQNAAVSSPNAGWQGGLTPEISSSSVSRVCGSAHALAPAAGVNPASLREAVLAGTARTSSMEAMERLRHPARAAHVLATLRKDVALAFAAFPPEEMAPWREPASAGLEALAALADSDGSLLG